MSFRAEDEGIKWRGIQGMWAYRGEGYDHDEGQLTKEAILYLNLSTLIIHVRFSATLPSRRRPEACAWQARGGVEVLIRVVDSR